MREEDVFKKVVEETGYDYELVRFVINRMWLTILFFVSHPAFIKRRIIINNFIKIYIPKRVFAKFLHKERYKDHLIQIIENERQAKRKDNYAGDSIKDSKKRKG